MYRFQHSLRYSKSQAEKENYQTFIPSSESVRSELHLQTRDEKGRMRTENGTSSDKWTTNNRLDTQTQRL